MFEFWRVRASRMEFSNIWHLSKYASALSSGFLLDLNLSPLAVMLAALARTPYKKSLRSSLLCALMMLLGNLYVMASRS